MIEKAGCQLLTVHGRTKEMKGQFTGLADWSVIKRIKDELHIPVISNGNIRNFEDVQNCLRVTQCDAVMSAEGLLHNPALFFGKEVDVFQVVYDYVDLCEKFPPFDPLWAKNHICKMLHSVLFNHHDLRDWMFQARRGWKVLAQHIRDIEHFVKTGEKPAELLSLPLRVENCKDASCSSVITQDVDLDCCFVGCDAEENFD